MCCYSRSVSRDLTVFSLLMLVLILFVPVLRWCQRADVVSEDNHRAHYLSDNNPEDLYFYAVCIHTGLCSAASMTAKVSKPLCSFESVVCARCLSLIFHKRQKTFALVTVATFMFLVILFYGGPYFSITVEHPKDKDQMFKLRNYVI